LYDEINSIVRKYFGLDVIVESIAKRLGNLRAVYLTGEIARGSDFSILDLIFVGDIDKQYLLSLIEKAEALIKRKIRYLVYTEEEFKNILTNNERNGYVLIWNDGI